MVIETCVCKQCGESYTYERLKGKVRLYCSLTCVHRASSEKRRARRKNRPAPAPRIRTCVRCGETFEARVNAQKFCSTACRAKTTRENRNERYREQVARPRYLTKPCDHCGTEFTTARTHGPMAQRFCTDKCQNAARRARDRELRDAKKAQRRCRHCKGPIPQERRMNARYCSTACSQAAYLKRYPYRYLGDKYRFSKRGYEAQLAAQGGRCAICGTESPGGMKEGGRFAVDHDHTTDEIRGLLCHNCNRGLGSMQDDPDILRKAIEYLRNPPARRRDPQPEPAGRR